MPSNSVLMQSYNLMKMSSEVTNKNQGTPQFANQDRTNDYYSKFPMDFNRNLFPPQKTPPPALDKHGSDQFLCKFILTLYG